MEKRRDAAESHQTLLADTNQRKENTVRCRLNVRGWNILQTLNENRESVSYHRRYSTGRPVPKVNHLKYSIDRKYKFIIYNYDNLAT